MAGTRELLYVIGPILIILYIAARTRSNKSKLPLPPGPRGLPVLGSFSALPKANHPEWFHWLTFKDKYGPISSFSILGQTFVLVHDADTALELLRDRAANYSERPVLTFVSEMVGWNRTVGFTSYTDTFRLHRKNIAKVLSSNVALRQLDRVQEEETAHFLVNMLQTPDNLFEHIRKEAGAVILRYIYGYTPEAEKKDMLVDMAGEAMDNLARGAANGAYAVDVFPFLKHIPDWFPGAAFKKTAANMRDQLNRTVDYPYKFVQAQMRAQTHKPSFISQALEMELDTDQPGIVEHIHKWSALSMYVGGADTTVSSLMTFFLCMALNPEVQKKAQDELDRVIGNDRLPLNSDKERLPYIDALVKEVHRWHPVAPVGLAHVTREEDTISGYRIPKGALVISNIWWFTHDPLIYHTPEAFLPERFLPSTTHTPELDPRKFIFGFGRRICPGRMLADHAVFTTIAQSLAVFNISLPVDEHGKTVQPKLEFSSGLVSHVLPYKVDIVPRSRAHEALIEEAGVRFPWGESDAEVLKELVL